MPGTALLARCRVNHLAVQAIYYPGFTFGGITEPLSVIVTALLALLLPAGSLGFWLTIGACVALMLMHATYWLLIHPVNNFWLRDVSPQGVGGAFFALSSGRPVPSGQTDWTYMRDRWEYSHLVRAGLAVLHSSCWSPP